jgi:hypothetical protein
MRPYWVSVENGIGIGVTARSEADAFELAAAVVPPDRRITGVRPIRKLEELDRNHVVPNMASWFVRGIWFPLGHALH